jgi:hypothetical protein
MRFLRWIKARVSACRKRPLKNDVEDESKSHVICPPMGTFMQPVMFTELTRGNTDELCSAEDDPLREIES